MIGRPNEAMTFVEPGGLFVDGVVDGVDDSRRAAAASRRRRPCGGLLRAALRRHLGLAGAVDCEPGEQHHPDRVGREPRTSLAGASWRTRPHGEAEVAHDVRAVGDDERPRRVHLLRGELVAAQPGVELVVAGVEGAEVVAGVETFDRNGEGFTPPELGVGGEQLDELGYRWAGLSSSAMNRSNASLDSTMSWWSLTRRARVVTVSSTKEVTVVSSMSAPGG